MPKTPKISLPLPRWQKWGLIVCFMLLLSSGLVWLYLEHFVAVEGEFGPENHPWQHTWLVVHGVASPMFAWLVGVLWTAHIKRHWRARMKRTSGVLMLIGCLVAALSALGLYYLANEQWRSVTSALHWILGCLFALVFLWHYCIHAGHNKKVR
jgi:hypothetical protein